jgi:3-hydroxyacyl-[acyl-carrier-protein] dehydratase
MGETPEAAPAPKPATPGSRAAKFVIDYAGILKALPHRFPFLLIDGVTAFESGKSIVGVKNVSFNEPFFSGHFPEDPVMPGVLQIEALAQASCLLVALSFPADAAGKRPAFAGINEARFRRPVRPGHVLTLHAELEKYRRGFATLKTRAEIDGEVAAEAGIVAAMV